MSFEEMVVALVGSIGAFALVGYLAAKTFNLVKTWINRNKGGVPEEEFNRLARAFMDYKKNSQRRLEHLEAIIADEEPNSQTQEQEQKPPKQIDAPNKEIEIEDSESASQGSLSSDHNNLRNMLRE
ncbi:hypothetical protein [Fodinibius sp. Rm-B-1B1-1]|uniref:hypothetical protein n=1 Tax=Fodinibius alkaliphilus TaxID=3140241 RepID=UPI00315A5E1C